MQLETTDRKVCGGAYVPFRALMLATRSWKPWPHKLGTSSSTISIFLPVNPGFSYRWSLWSALSCKRGGQTQSQKTELRHVLWSSVGVVWRDHPPLWEASETGGSSCTDCWSRCPSVDTRPSPGWTAPLWTHVGRNPPSWEETHGDQTPYHLLSVFFFVDVSGLVLDRKWMKTDVHQHNKHMDLTHGPDSTITDPTFSSPFSVTSLHSAENSALQPWKFSNSNSTTWITHGAGSQEGIQTCSITCRHVTSRVPCTWHRLHPGSSQQPAAPGRSAAPTSSWSTAPPLCGSSTHTDKAASIRRSQVEHRQTHTAGGELRVTVQFETHPLNKRIVLMLL